MKPYEPPPSPTPGPERNKAAGPAQGSRGESDVWAARPGSGEPPDDAPPPRKPGKAAAKSQPPAEGWERSVLEKLAFASLREQRRARRWRLLFTLLFFGYIGFITWTVMQSTVLPAPAAQAHTAIVRINGTIAEDEQASARYLLPALRQAFEASNANAVVLSINSPGGSPVQAGIVHDEILRLKDKHGKPVHAVVGDVGASAAYYIAVAADEIHVDKASLVGSIGVLMNGFGFTDAMDKLGVERRLLSAGEHKGFLDPFSPQNPADVAHAQKMLAQIHQQFVQVVREGRGERLKQAPELFSGLVWTGEESVQLGLADRLGSVHSVARDVVGQERVVDYTQRRGLADQLANRLGAALGNGAGAAALRQLQGAGAAWP